MGEKLGEAAVNPEQLVVNLFRSERESIKPKMNIPEVEKFIADNFKLVKCNRYVRVDLTVESLTTLERRLFSDSDCVCGRPLTWHVENKISNAIEEQQQLGYRLSSSGREDGESSARKKSDWNVQKDTVSYTCDTFGQLVFRAGDGVDSSEILPGASAKYIRLDGRTQDPDYLEAVYQLMTNEQYWGMSKPGLLMEITGSTSDFPYIDQLTIERFNDGLLKAAKSANAWIITNGINRGVMKLVGEAVAQTRMAHIDREVTCLGIGSWGTVKYRECLAPAKPDPSGDGEGDAVISVGRPTPNVVRRIINLLPHIDESDSDEMVVEPPEKKEEPIAHGKWPVDYFIDTKEEPNAPSTALDQNHNYFLLVDNGREKRFGEEITFRARLMDHFSRKKLPGSGVATDSGMDSSTPSLLIVIGGGETALRTVEETLSISTDSNAQVYYLDEAFVPIPRPVILLPGFGGTADIIAFAYEITEKKEEKFKEDEKKLKKPKLSSQKSNMASGTSLPNIRDRRNPAKESYFPDDFDKQILEHPEMEWLLRTTPASERRAKASHFVNIIRGSLANRKMISVYDIFAEGIERKEPLDTDILQAIFKAELGSPAVMMELAQMWNRADFAKTILQESSGFIKKTMNCTEAMLRAVANGQDKFCKMFDDYNLIDTKKFVTRNVMAELYDRVFVRRTSRVNKSCISLFRSFLFEHMGEEEEDLSRDEFLKILGHILAQKIGCYIDNLFTETVVPIIGKSRQSDEFAFDDEIDFVTQAITRPLSRAESFRSARRKMTRVFGLQGPDPASTPYMAGMRDIFLFALLINSKDLSLDFWLNGQDHLGTALFAAKFLQTLSEDAERSGLIDLACEYEARVSEWQKRALDVLTVCYDDNPERTNRLLTRSLVTWQDYSALEIAYHADQQEFMSHPAVQTKLKQLWHGRIAPFSSTTLVYLSTICWPLVFKLKFLALSSMTHNQAVVVEESATSTTTAKTIDCSNNCVTTHVPKNQTRRRYIGARLGWDLKEDDSAVPFFKAVYCVYSSPKMKFLLHSIAMFLSLLSFSYFNISGPKVNEITFLEFYIWIWTAVNFADKLKESFGEQLLNKFSENLSYFIYQPWNWIDIIAQICLSCSFIARLVLLYNANDHIVLPRTMYALACLVYWIKAFHIFYVTQTLGPKVITLFKMMQDLFFFVALYLVILSSFSVPIYVLMYPTKQSDEQDFMNNIGKLFAILYGRWWDLVGIEMDDSKLEVEGSPKSCVNPASACSQASSVISRLIVENNTNETEILIDLNETLAAEAQLETDPCPEANFVAVGLYIVFLVITNIMLLNMLIAMLTHTVDAVREHAIRLWRFHIYRITYEFYRKALLPPPFMLGEMIYGLIRHIRQKTKKERRSSCIKEFFLPNDFEYQKLSLFERSAAFDLVEAEAGEQEEASKSAILSKLKLVHQKLYRKLDKVEAKIGDLAARHSSISPS